MTSNAQNIAKVVEHIAKCANPAIRLLRDPNVVQWLFGDLTFLPPVEKTGKKKEYDEKLKNEEDTWGRTTMKLRRPDLKLEQQWTNKFGEHICEEIYALHGKVVTKPAIMENYQPDLEVDDAIIEAKAQTFYTSGTAGEKIMGVPFKYADIPELHGDKPLKIVCMGGAEQVCREGYGNLPGPKCSAKKKKFLEFYRENQIEFVGATDLLMASINS
jgi:hypothetical protein